MVLVLLEHVFTYCNGQALLGMHGGQDAGWAHGGSSCCSADTALLPMAITNITRGDGPTCTASRAEAVHATPCIFPTLRLPGVGRKKGLRIRQPDIVVIVHAAVSDRAAGVDAVLARVFHQPVKGPATPGCIC